MSEENESSPEVPATPTPQAAPRARKATKSRAKKVAKPAEAPEKAPDKVPVESPQIQVVEEVEPASQEAPSQPGGDWPDTDGDSAGGPQGQGESGKRKRRRRKGKGQSSQAQAAGEENQQSGAAESKPSDPGRDQGPRQEPRNQQRVKVDPDDHAKMAWKIYLAEVSEEGVALIGDNDAKDLARRCFRLAEIFLEEQGRRR